MYKEAERSWVVSSFAKIDITTFWKVGLTVFSTQTTNYEHLTYFLWVLFKFLQFKWPITPSIPKVIIPN